MNIKILILKAYKLFIFNFNNLLILTIPIALTNIIILYFSSRFPLDILIKNDPLKGFSVFILLNLVNISVITFFSISIFYSAYKKNKGIEISLTDSIKRASKKFLPYFGLVLLFFLISIFWLFITFLPLIFNLFDLNTANAQSSLYQIIFILFCFISIMFYIFALLVPFVLFSQPDICIQEKSKIICSFSNGLTKIKGYRLKGFIFILIILLIQFIFILVFFYITLYVVVLINPKMIQFLNPVFLNENTQKISLYFGFTSSIISLLLTPFQICSYVIFYEAIEDKNIFTNENNSICVDQLTNKDKTDSIDQI
jgi:hypothetical protein